MANNVIFGGFKMTTQIVIGEENFYDILESKIYNASDKEFIDFIEKEFYQLKSLQVNKYKKKSKAIKTHGS